MQANINVTAHLQQMHKLISLPQKQCTLKHFVIYIDQGQHKMFIIV